MYSVVGYCTKCGAPIYSYTVWHGINPPPIYYSCSCYKTKYYNTNINIESVKENKDDVDKLAKEIAEMIHKYFQSKEDTDCK